ncbi:MAG: alanine racemase [Gammaproteobacteria bacterium]|nr:alanine racemase [Gammaproteobacteria bacterium]MCW5583486.1 alanine racemase [Gammaproteobacteria bacterium]
MNTRLIMQKIANNVTSALGSASLMMMIKVILEQSLKMDEQNNTKSSSDFNIEIQTVFFLGIVSVCMRYLSAMCINYQDTKKSEKGTSAVNQVISTIGGATLGLMVAYEINSFIHSHNKYEVNYVANTHADFLSEIFYYLYSRLDPLKVSMALIGAYAGYQSSQFNDSQETSIDAKRDLAEYAVWRKILKGKPLPAGIVDLDAFDHNLDTLAKVVSDSNKKNTKRKTIRIATKSIRVPALIKHALEREDNLFQGVMCYTVEEAKFLNDQGIRDIMIAYPTVQYTDLNNLRELHMSGAQVSLVLDNLEQLQLVAKAMNGMRHPLPIVIEMDTSLRLLEGSIHLGVRRSPVRTSNDLRNILHASKDHPSIKVIGVMAYEAAVAGLPDKNPFKTMMNFAAVLVRKASIFHVEKIRAQVPEIFKSAGLELKIFNGGGTGSVNFTAAEEGLTEVTIGSGLLCSHLFDYYSNLQKIGLKPAIFFALPVGRMSDSKYITCSGGGYVASGAPGWDRLPIPISPPGLQPLGEEAYGEVQTPLRVTGLITPKLGGPVLFRPAKAGEIAERFNEYFLISGSQITKNVKTYRGYGLKSL